ncbi:uncharacterized protein LOC143276888 [Babylonia areolata]|uniref:uncharacterized protein LOC143276888 n=1 Tax=Babylonia areolata TaxID=304850 RepID=UPI003FD2723E
MHIQEDQHSELRVKLCEGSSMLSRVAALVAMGALVLHVVSVSCSYWMEGTIRDGESAIAHTGLWQDCVLQNLFASNEFWFCASYQASHHQDTAPSFMKVSQAFAILGIFGQVASAVLLLIFILLPKLSCQRAAFFASLAASASSALFVLVAVIVFPTGYPDRQMPPFPVTWAVSWCVGLDVLSLLSSLAVMVLLLFDFRARSFRFAMSSSGSAA